MPYSMVLMGLLRVWCMTNELMSILTHHLWVAMIVQDWGTVHSAQNKGWNLLVIHSK